MKVCSLYGAGYYYIPGTDTCIKIGGFVRFDTAWNGEVSGASPWVNRTYNHVGGNYYEWRARYMIGLDTRTQTEYGTLRSYIRAGWQFTTGSVANGSQGDNGTGDRTKDGGVYTERAFIQFAGFTFGKTQSFFDVWSAGAVASSNLWGYDDTGNGINLFAYTALLGNGVSLSVSAEDPQAYRRMTVFQGLNTGNQLGFGSAPNSYGNAEIPDFVGTLRVDQAWGSAMIGGLVHNVRPGYYTTPGVTSSLGTQINGGPGDKWGWAVTGGVDINLPWNKGDRFVAQATYTVGVMGTIMGGVNNTTISLANDNKAAVGYIVDGVFADTPGSSVELTTGWGVVGGIEHYWVPNLRSSLFGSYTKIDYNDAATATLAAAASRGAAVAGLTGGNFDLNLWQIGTRTVWTPVPNLDLSVEALYSNVDQNLVGTVLPPTTGTTRVVDDFDQWTFMFRVQRNFWP